MINAQLLEHTKEDLGKLAEAVVTVENGEPLVAIAKTDRIGLTPIWEGDIVDAEFLAYKDYIKKYPSYTQIQVRKTVADMLNAAAGNLPKNWKLLVVAGHRPLEVQQTLYNDIRTQLRARNPELTDEEVDTMTRLYVADPSRKPPGHCCGAAVDVNVLDASMGLLVDFGSAINLDTDKSALHNNAIPKQAMQNRLILLEAMLDAGFSSLHSEWWHYSYGDQNWAAFYGKPQAMYGIKDVA
jgi:zinc D-Ala-D-Ala dipeptidase